MLIWELRNSVYLVDSPFGNTGLFILEPPVRPSFCIIVVCDCNLNTLFTKLHVITGVNQAFILGTLPTYSSIVALSLLTQILSFWMYRLMFLIKFGKFSDHISSNIVSAPFPLFWVSHYAAVGVLDWVPQASVHFPSFHMDAPSLHPCATDILEGLLLQITPLSAKLISLHLG